MFIFLITDIFFLILNHFFLIRLHTPLLQNRCLALMNAFFFCVYDVIKNQDLLEQFQ